MEKFYDIEFNPSNNSVFNFNDGVRIVLVLKNKLKFVSGTSIHKFVSGTSIHKFQAGDVFIINHRERYRLIEEDDTLYTAIHLKASYLKQYISDYNDKVYILNSQTLQNVIYQQILTVLSKIDVVS